MSSDMAYNVEPMDIDCINSDFDNKENTFNHNNALPCTEKGYEELDVSELNMKLRYSLTPTTSPMSKSFTNCTDNSSFDSDDAFNYTLNESNLTRSLNSTITKNEKINKSFKTLPLQSLPTDQNTDKSTTVPRQSDSAIISECNNMTVTISGTSDMEDNISLSSTTSSVLHTPEATTPTKETKTDGGSPILRGLKSVLNMFRSSQSPITAADTNSVVNKPETLTSVEDVQTKATENFDFKPQSMASTPIAAPRLKESNGSRRSSPYKDSIIFNDDLEKELQWKDETTIIFSHEKIPVHKLFFQQAKTIPKSAVNEISHNVENIIEGNLRTADIMDTQCNEPVIEDNAISDVQEKVINNEFTVCNDSDSEFVDCETTFIKNDSNIFDNVQNELTNENNVDHLNSDLENNKDFLDGKEDELMMTESPCKFQNIEHNTSLHVMIDSLDIVVNEKQSLTEFSTENNLKTDETVLQLDNTIVISQPKEITTKTGPENNVCSEYELDSLEYNCMIKTNDINITNNNDNRIDDSSKQDTEIGREAGSICNRHLPLPTEIPLPDDDYNEIELNMTHKSIELSNRLILPISETNTITQDSSDEMTVFQDLLNVGKRTDVLLIKNEKVNEILYTNAAFIQEEVSTIKAQNTDNVFSFVKNSIAKDEQTVIQNKDQICFELKDLEIAKSCENKITLSDAMNQIKSLDSVDEITSECLINERGQNDYTQISSRTASINHMIVDQKAGYFIDIEKYNEIPDVTHIPGEMVVTDLVISFQATENKAEVALTTVNEEIIISNLQSEENLENTVQNCNLLEEHKDNFVKEGNVAKHDSYNKVDEIILNENLACNLTNREIFQKHEVILDANKIQSYQENNKENSDEPVAYKSSNKELLEVTGIFDLNVIENDQNIHSNESLGINFVHKDLEGTDTLMDNKVEEINTDIQEIYENLLEKVIIDNITVEHASEAVSNEQKLENTIQNDSEDTKAIHFKELSLNEITSDMNKHTIHTEIPETLEINTTLKKNILEDNVSDMLDQTSNEKSENINLDTEQMKVMFLDKSLTINTNYLNKDDNISELDTLALEEEIVLSENNSPYVSVAGDLDKVSIDQNSATLTLAEDANTTVTISNSPPITSKGYNFNFDEIDDPFAIKTNNIKSPTFETNIEYAVSTINNTISDQSKTPKKVLGKNRRKTQFERKKHVVATQKLNKSFSGGTPLPESLTNAYKLDEDCSTKNKILEEKTVKSTTDSDNNGNLMIHNDKPLTTIDYDKNNLVDVPDASNCNRLMNEKCSNILNPSEVNKSITGTITDESSTYQKNSLSSDQSSYDSNITSSGEVIQSRNVFNLPEIDDMNFNPFAVKSKLCQSPPSNLDEDNPFVTRTKLLVTPETSHINIETQNTDSMDKLADKDCEDKMDTEPMEKGASANRSSDTNSSNVSQKDTTVREINTEDEDTIEGPFLDDINNDEMSCSYGDNVDMMKFNDIPNQESEDNAEGELFIDAEAFQFLLNQNKSNIVADSGKESLFLKFDPLFAKKISSDSIITALSKVQNKQSTPIKTEKRESIISTPASSSALNTTFEKENVNNTEANNDNLNITVSKPMMVVPPAVNAIATPRKSQTPTRTNRHSCTITSPAIAVIDRLLSLSANNSLVEHEASFTQVSREQTEANLALTQLRELLAEKEIQVYNLRSESKDLKDRLLVLESHMRTLETESQQRLNKIDELTATLSKKTNMDRNMAVVFEEYESTIANLIAQIEKDKKQHAEERNALINERNEQTAHLTNMEVSFNDLHSKYEKIKQVIANYKTNEEAYKKTLLSYEENFKKAQNNYELLKQHATSKLNYANEELQKLNKAHEAEVLKMNAMIKRKDLHITSLEETLAQKTKANEELTAICDELINKVG